MFKRIIAICVIALFAGVVTPVHAQRSGTTPAWTKLAGKTIDRRAGRASFSLRSIKRPMKSIRFQSLRRSLRLTSVTIYFKGGQRQRVKRTIRLRPNRQSRPIKLRSNGRLIDKITITYSRSKGRKRWSGLQIYGWAGVVKPVFKPQVIAKLVKPKKTNPGRIGQIVRRPTQTVPRTYSTRTQRVRQADGTYKTVTRRVRTRAKARREVRPVLRPKTSSQAQRRRTAAARRTRSGESRAATRSDTPAAPAPPPLPTTRSMRAPAPAPAPVPLAEERSGSTPSSEAGDMERERVEAVEIPANDLDRGAPEPAASESKDYDVMPVYYGTDRKLKQNEKRAEYTTDRAEKLQLGRALVTVPRTHKMPNVERPWAINIPFWGRVQLQSEDPKKHFTMKELKALSEEDFLKFVKRRLAQSQTYKNQALVFIHGFNNTFDGAIYRTAQIAFDLKFDSAPFLYSWPSAGGLTSYFYDRESATASRPHLRKFLELITKKTGVDSVSIIAHSMGNVALLEVLRDLKNLTPDSVKINQIILAAPDVGVTNFKILAREIKGMSNGVTLYASSNDRALDISRQFFGGVPRAGDVPDNGPIVVEGIDTIDVSAVSTDSLSTNHSNYAQTTALMNDIERLLKTGARPPQIRSPKLETVQKTTAAGDVLLLPNGDPARYWRYRAR